MIEVSKRQLMASSRTLIAAALLGKFGGTARADDLLDISQLKLTTPPTPSPSVTFLRPDGTQATLKDYLGKGIVLNFWATWCPPCVAELPSLDRLAATLAGSSIQVVAISEDLGDKAAAKVQKYYAAHAITRLPVLIDHFGKASDAFANQGVPTTLLIDAKGNLTARFEGGTDWSSPAAQEKIKQLIGQG